MSLCLLTLWHSKVYTFILIRVGDKAWILRWVIIDWAGCEQAKTDHIYIVPEIQIMVWRDHCGQCSWHNPKLDVDPPGPECWLPCFACGPDERLLTPEWWPLLGWPIGLASLASHWSISGLTDLWLAETGLDTHNTSHLTLSNNYPEGDKLSRLGDETKHDVSLVSYATVLQSQVVRQHQPIRGQHTGSQPMSRQTAQQSHLRHFIPRREWFYGSNFLCSFKTGGSEFQVTAGTLSSHWLNNNVQSSHWLRDFYSAVSTF